MKITLAEDLQFDWKVEKIGVIGPGIVGMPMAALLANARIKIGTDQPARVMVVQRNSKNSGWKVDAINSGKSVIGGIEPGLNAIVEECVKEGLLGASHDYAELSDADMILISVQTDKKGFEPDYGPLFGALETLAKALQNKPADKVPLIVYESTLAPSSMATLIKEHFASYGLIEGRDILLGNSPNRVMPGRLVHRVTHSDKLIGGLHPETPRMIEAVYSQIVTEGTLHLTNSMTAEVVKTLENAYRDVRIALSTEIVRYCDENNIDYYKVRDLVNEKLSQTDDATTDPNAVPSGGLLIPMVGVGGHCLPKDGILLWWRKIESGADTSSSLIVRSREINDESPAETIKLAERKFGSLDGKKVAILGAAYRFNSEDTRNSPSIVLAKQLREKGCDVHLQDYYVKGDDQNIVGFGVADLFTNDLEAAVKDADYIFMATAHKGYMDDRDEILAKAENLQGLIDACNIYQREDIEAKGIGYTGIGRGADVPSEEFVDFVAANFIAMERGVANEVQAMAQFLNERYAEEAFNKVTMEDVQKLGASCSTGCIIADPAPITEVPQYEGFQTRLATYAFNQGQPVA
ncbi:MAG: nucleotide sugar dehydrogenase [Bacteroidota bacterium]